MKSKLILAFISILSFSAVAWSDEVKDESKKLEGTWLPTTAELKGMPFSEQILKMMKLVIKDGKYTVTVGQNKDQGTLKIDPSAKVKTMDITGTEGPNKGKTIPAIYELDGDTLKVCYDLSCASRPTEFKTESNSAQFLVTYKRQGK